MERFQFCIIFVVHVFLYAVNEPLEQKNHPNSIFTKYMMVEFVGFMVLKTYLFKDICDFK